MSLLNQNEKEANLLVSKVMRITAVNFFINLSVECDRNIYGR